MQWRSIILSLFLFVFSFILVSYGGKVIGGSADNFSVQLAESSCEGQQCILPTNKKNDEIISTNTSHREIKLAIFNHVSETKTALQYFANNYFLVLAQFWIIGVLLGLTPCVLPLIILMVGFLGGQANQISRKRAILFSMTYVVSLSVTYAVLGILIATGGSYLQSYFQQTWVLATASIAIFLLSLSLLGFYKIKLPPFIQHYVVKHNKFKSNYQFIEVAIMGILATLIASPCVAAPLAIILGYIGATGNLMLGGLVLFFVGLGIGTPLIVASIFNKEILPHSGKWQYILKTFFALLMMSVALWLSISIMPVKWNMVLWSLLIIFTSVYMWELTRDNVNTNLVLFWKSLCIMVLVLGIAIFVGHIFGKNNPFQLSQENWVGETYSLNYITVDSNTKLDNEITAAVKSHRPVFLLFTADWCIACKDFHENVLNTTTISSELKRFTLLKADLSIAGSITYDIARRYKVPGAPYVILFDHDGVVNPQIITGDVTAPQLYETLQTVQ